VLLALPFSVSGALMALWVAGQSLNVYSLLGMILLMGIAKKNSILLVDFTNQLREQGAERHDALLQPRSRPSPAPSRPPWPSAPGPRCSVPWPSPSWEAWPSPPPGLLTGLQALRAPKAGVSRS
jgi:hypothetical protein